MISSDLNILLIWCTCNLFI